MSEPEAPRDPEVQVRVSGPADVAWVDAAVGLIHEAAAEHDIAERSPAMLRHKIESGRAALALQRRGGTEELVGFGYYSEWEGGRFVSHSGLVVRPELRGRGLGRRLKQALFQASRERFPDANVTTEILEAPEFYYAEDYHQQYLSKNPGGYCGLGGTGLRLPSG